MTSSTIKRGEVGLFEKDGVGDEKRDWAYSVEQRREEGRRTDTIRKEGSTLLLERAQRGQLGRLGAKGYSGFPRRALLAASRRKKKEETAQPGKLG